MSFVLSDFGFTLGLFIAMLLCFDLGRRFGVGRLSLDPDGVTKGSGPVEAAVFGLLGLLLAFTFSGAAARFEERRFLIATEASEISTAYQRVDLLPESAQPEIRELFRRYLETRIVVYRDAADEALTATRVDDTVALQVLLWEKALAATADPTARAAASMLLVSLSLMASMLAGYVLCVGKGRNWFYMLLFSTTISLTLYVIIDMEYPRYGLIRVDAADQTLMNLREPMQ